MSTTSNHLCASHRTKINRKESKGPRGRNPHRMSIPPLVRFSGLAKRQLPLSIKREFHGLRNHPKLKPLLSLISKDINLESKAKELDYTIVKNPALSRVIRGMLGQTVYNFRIAYGGGGPGAYVTSTAAGIIQSRFIISTLLTASTDWAALSGLFDEFLWEETEMHMTPLGAGFAVASPGMTAMCFDDDGVSGVPTSYDQVMSYSNSKLFCPAIQGSSLTTEANSTGLHPIIYKNRRQYHVADNAPVANAGTTGWVDMATPANLLGAWMAYNSLTATTANAYNYVAVSNVRFRCRL